MAALAGAHSPSRVWANLAPSRLPAVEAVHHDPGSMIFWSLMLLDLEFPGRNQTAKFE